MGKIIILDNFPNYYFQVKSFILIYKTLFHWSPEVITDCKETQLHILRKDIPNNIVSQHLTYQLLSASIHFRNSPINDKMMQSIGNYVPIDLFIKFDTKSDMIKYKLKN